MMLLIPKSIFVVLGFLKFLSCQPVGYIGGSTAFCEFSTFNFYDHVNSLDVYQTYSASFVNSMNISITAYGFTLTGRNESFPVNLFGKIDPQENELGLGIFNSLLGAHEIAGNEFIQLNLSLLYSLYPLQNYAEIKIASVQYGEFFGLYGSQTLGELGSRFYYNGFVADDTYVPLSDFGKYPFISVKAEMYNVLLKSLRICSLVYPSSEPSFHHSMMPTVASPVKTSTPSYAPSINNSVLYKVFEWDFSSYTGTLGDCVSYSSGSSPSIILEACGYKNEEPTALYGKNEEPNEHGLGIASTERTNEIIQGCYIQLNMSSLSASGRILLVMMESVTGIDTFALYGSTTKGVMGTVLLYQGELQQLLISLPTSTLEFPFVSITAINGDVLLSRVVVECANSNVPLVEPTITPAFSTIPTTFTTVNSSPSLLPTKLTPTVIPSNDSSEISPNASTSVTPTIFPSASSLLLVMPSIIPTTIPTASSSKAITISPVASPSLTPTIVPNVLSSHMPTPNPVTNVPIAHSISPAVVHTIAPTLSTGDNLACVADPEKYTTISFTNPLIMNMPSYTFSSSNGGEYNVTVFGFYTADGTSTDICGKILFVNSEQDDGLGICYTQNNEISKKTFIQIDISLLLQSSAGYSLEIRISSVQWNESFAIHGSNEFGVLGDVLYRNGSSANNIFSGLPLSYLNYKYISVTAVWKNVLLSALRFCVAETRLTIIPSVSPSFGLIKRSLSPTSFPSLPITSPLYIPSADPTSKSFMPTILPSITQSVAPSFQPSIQPSAVPTFVPTILPTYVPSAVPTVKPSFLPTILPSINPSVAPSFQPSIQPSDVPTFVPTILPTDVPSAVPTGKSSFLPTILPSINPSVAPSFQPSIQPSAVPTFTPTMLPTYVPSDAPSFGPSSYSPTFSPTRKRRPTSTPTISSQPSVIPTYAPTAISLAYQPGCSLSPALSSLAIPSGHDVLSDMLYGVQTMAADGVVADCGSSSVRFRAYFKDTGLQTRTYFKTSCSVDETGLGLNFTRHNEINKRSFIQIDFSVLYQNPGISQDSALTIVSVQPGESFELYGSNVRGQLGTVLLYSGDSTMSNTPIRPIPGFLTYNYISVTATVGDVLIGSLGISCGGSLYDEIATQSPSSSIYSVASQSYNFSNNKTVVAGVLAISILIFILVCTLCVICLRRFIPMPKNNGLKSKAFNEWLTVGTMDEECNSQVVTNSDSGSIELAGVNPLVIRGRYHGMYAATDDNDSLTDSSDQKTNGSQSSEDNKNDIFDKINNVKLTLASIKEGLRSSKYSNNHTDSSASIISLSMPLPSQYGHTQHYLSSVVPAGAADVVQGVQESLDQFEKNVKLDNSNISPSSLAFTAFHTSESSVDPILFNSINPLKKRSVPDYNHREKIDVLESIISRRNSILSNTESKRHSSVSITLSSECCYNDSRNSDSSFKSVPVSRPVNNDGQIVNTL